MMLYWYTWGATYQEFVSFFGLNRRMSVSIVSFLSRRYLDTATNSVHYLLIANNNIASNSKWRDSSASEAEKGAEYPFANFAVAGLFGSMPAQHAISRPVRVESEPKWFSMTAADLRNHRKS
jgi:hypothetical protein